MTTPGRRPNELARRRALAVFAAGASLLAAPALRAQAQVPVRFTLNLPRNGTNSPFLYALDRGLFAANGIRITTMDPALGADALTRVAGGTHDVGFVDLSTLVEFHATNPGETPLAVFNVFNRTPTCVVTWKSANIARPADLVGKLIGGPLTDVGFRLFPLFFRANALDPASVRFNNMDLRLREALFLRREVDAITGFDATIWFNLRAQGVKFEDITILRYADWGLDLYSNSVVVSRRFLRDNEAAIPGLLRAVAAGWRGAIRDPEAVTQALQRADSLVNATLELDRLRWVIDNQVAVAEARERGIGDVRPERLQRGIDQIAEGFSLARKPGLDDIWTSRFLPPAGERAVG